MLNKLTTSFLGIFIALAILSGSVNAQALQDMTINISDGTYQTISGGTFLTSGDDNYRGVYFPFDFKWDNHTYTGNTDIFYVSCNGYMWMTPPNGSYPYYYWTNPLHSIYPSIQPIRGDLYTRGEVIGGVSGSAPNRVLILQWSNVDFYYSYSANMNFQIRMYETSNKVEIIYGQMSRGSYSWWRKMWTGFTGYYSQPYQYTNVSFIELVPGATYGANFSKNNGGAPTSGNGTIDGTTFDYITNGKTISLTAFPSLVDTYPTDGTILRRGQIYDGAQHPAMFFNRIAGQADVYGMYSISGPLPADPVNNPDFRTIYTGTQADLTSTLIYFNPQPVGTMARADIPYATGIAAGTNGALDLQTNESQIVGGEYIVESEMRLPGFNYVQQLPAKTFVIALDYDLAVTKLLSPRKKQDKKYPLSIRIPISARITNIGLTTYNSFNAQALIILNNDTIYDQTVIWPTNPPQSLSTGDYVDIDFPSFRPVAVGDYQLVIKAIPTDPTRDDEWSNNILPRERDDDFYFNVAYEIEAEPIAILAPSNSIYVGRPILPMARFRNNGVSDISDAPASIAIFRNVAPYDTIFRDNVIVQDIPSGRYNTTDAFFSSNFIPPGAGEYGVCVTVSIPDDPVVSNNSYCDYFHVVDAMAGTYTIGTRYSASARNFLTIQDALDNLYLKGVTGPVTFLMTDANYVIGDAIAEYPAWDMSGKIIGVSEDNPIVFKPSQDRSLTTGSVTINLVSGGGVGVYIAQNIEPSNPYAAVHHVTTGLKKEYANTNGYITFDGGSQKSFKFILNTNIDFNAVFYIGRGAQHNTIKNCLVQTNTSTCAYALPRTKYDAALGGFNYETDIRTSETYSTGILIRNTYPKDKNENSNLFRLDTLRDAYNVVSGNDISGFAYGVVALGIGPLFNEGESRYQRFYNMENKITDNEIHNICRAGIFLGHEENTLVANNRIYGVSNTSESTYGILAGGQGDAQWFGYNNINVTIDANEINNVSSGILAGGIVAEQAQNFYPFSNPSFITFPDVPESMHIANNAIWNLNISDANASRVGIQVFTEREINNNWLTMMLTPKVANYYSRNDQIVNNTVWMRGDNNGVSSSSATCGIALQQTSNTLLNNNAVAMTDDEVNSNAVGYAGFFLQGVMPADGSVNSDRNAFWTSTAANAAFYQFVQMDEDGNVVDYGNKDDYKTLEQWQNWTGQDYNSVVGDFTQDYIFLGTAPRQQLRIQTEPAPLGSILNNRGNNIAWARYDIDGTRRGAAGQRYDIGHVEFDGRLYLSDMEAIKITKPASYQSSEGFFSDAQYIMTTAPVNIKGLFRNSGNLPQNGVTATLNIYREQPNGIFSAVPELTTTTLINAPTTQNAEADWQLADGVAPDFVPQSYSDLAGQGYVAPNEFITMEANVTPKYKLVISIGADQNNANNIKEKIVRFYISKANLRMVLSAENSFQDLNNTLTADEIAGKLNFNALSDAFAKLGWIVNPADSRFDYDIFDRAGWEPKAVNYTMYRTMFWSDGDDAPLTRYQVSDINKFLALGNTTEKRNLIIGSQELAREHMNGGANQNTAFVGEVLRTDYVAPGNPLGAGVSNDNNFAIGVSIARLSRNPILATGVSGDQPPYCGLVSIYPEGEGLSTPAFYYENHDASQNDSIAGVATTTLNRNVCYYPVDWRHWGNLDMIVRATIDYIEKNGGTIIPVELTDFEAIARGKKVDLSWKTASEYNSARFEIERAIKTESGVTAFDKIAENKAKGTSVSETVYGPVTDNNVEFGKTYVYKLKIVDLNGEYSYSSEREVTIGGDNTSWISAPVPNPVENEATIKYSVAQAGQVEINLYDMSGKLIRTLLNQYNNEGVHSFRINVEDLLSGQYNIVMKTDGQQFVVYIQVVK